MLKSIEGQIWDVSCMYVETLLCPKQVHQAANDDIQPTGYLGSSASTAGGQDIRTGSRWLLGIWISALKPMAGKVIRACLLTTKFILGHWGIFPHHSLQYTGLATVYWQKYKYVYKKPCLSPQALGLVQVPCHHH